MSQRFCLFFAGYSASAPSLYYNRMQLLNNYFAEENDQSNEHIRLLTEQTHELRDESQSNIRTAISIASHFKLNVLWQPEVAEEYFEWLKDYIYEVEEEFPLTRIEHYYFFYSRKITDMLSHIGMVITLCELAQYLNMQQNVLKQADTHLSEIEILIFRHKAATALLSSEPRHGFFRELYNEISEGFEKFKTVKVPELDGAGLQALQAGMEEFKFLIRNGFKKCIMHLKDLGV